MLSGWSSLRADPMPLGSTWSGTECRRSEYADQIGSHQQMQTDHDFEVGIVR
jgi:hypothetical protein